MSDISVVIPAYNRAGLIGETLRSLLNQSLQAKEIIVVDDGSTDGTAEAAKREFSVFSEQFSAISKSGIQHPILKILHQVNSGPGAARNRGGAEATGEFIHFFDSDDYAAPNKHEVQMRALVETGADIAYGAWVKGCFAPKSEGRGEFSAFSFQLSGFSAEGPVLQARGLPKGDLVKALLTNWSVVPHACLFRRSILEKAGGFPEDIWVGEDQLLFLRCLLAGAKVVHTPGTMVYYWVGDDPGKLTATGSAQKRHARDWGRFLLKANEEVSGAERRGTSAGKRVPAEAQRRGDFLTMDGADIHGFQKTQQGDAQGTFAGAAFSNPFASELARDSENTPPTRSASAPASLPATSYSLPATYQPSSWFGFRLRAFEAWRDLGRFFPDGENELKKELQGIWKKNRFSVFSFQFSGFILRKLAGLKLRVLGYREHASFRCGNARRFLHNLK